LAGGLLRFEFGINLHWLLLGVMHWTIRLGANLPQFAFVDPTATQSFVLQ
jgi:hypothetical protein